VGGLVLGEGAWVVVGKKKKNTEKKKKKNTQVTRC